ncbi:MAG: DUF938 domain-containing protein [Marinosulfonomonas sp.]|nr:DUF938 domain-containing protein [Marinosulfonomonas sp.]
MAAKKLNLPDTASVAAPGPDGRLHAPSANRNASAIRNIILKHAGQSGRALEIASGTGQHIAMLAQALPGFTWQPTDVDADRLESIASWTQYCGCKNVHPPALLDATNAGWAARHYDYDLVLMVNLLHLIDADGAKNAVDGIANALAPGGTAMIYGPFLRGDKFASNGDQAFHKSLIDHDSAIGYKSFQTVQGWQEASGLVSNPAIEMPANNLMLVARKPARP